MRPSSSGELIIDICIHNQGMLLDLSPSNPDLAQLPIPTSPKLLVC